MKKYFCCFFSLLFVNKSFIFLEIIWENEEKIRKRIIKPSAWAVKPANLPYLNSVSLRLV